MGQADSKKKIEQEFQIYKVQRDGNVLLKNKKDNKQYLMRSVACATQADMDRLKTLLECRAQLKNQHLLSLVEIKQKQQDFICSMHFKMYLVLEYSFKNLAQEIKDRASTTEKNYFQESDIWSILYSCSTALNILYSNGATHESLTSQQIFINKDGFVKISEPLLFGLEKNHIDALRTKQSNILNVHLSPEIIGCLDEENYIYYDKEKSDVFVLAMIIIDVALLVKSSIYDPIKKKPMLDKIQHLLNDVGERYSGNLVSILSEMLKLQSRYRPSLLQIIEKVQKFNNIGEDFTVQSESNAKYNELCSSRDQQQAHFQKPIKYRQLQIKPDYSGHKKTEPIPINIYTTGMSIQQQSLSIKQPVSSFNNQNFDGRVFASTPHHNTQVNFANSYHNIEIINPPYHHPQPPIITEKILSTNIKHNFDLYQRSRSIDSIKLASNEFSKPDMIKHEPTIMTKPFTPVYQHEVRRVQIQQPPRTRIQPLFTHQIPQVYNILVKNNNRSSLPAPPKVQIFTNIEKKYERTDNFIEKNHVPTPQFHGDNTKVNRFTSFKNFPYETVSRSGDEPESPSFPPELRRNVSHTRSEQQSTTNYKKQYEQTPPDPFANQGMSKFPFSGSVASSFKQTSNHAFGSASPFAGSSPAPANLPFSSSNQTAFGVGNSSPIVSSSFIPGFPSPMKQNQSYTCRSGFSHLSLFHNDEDDVKLQYIKQQVADRGSYQGYKYNQQRNGHGVLHFIGGGRYEGEWKNDKMHGFGKLYYQNSSIAYEGHWQNDEFNGQGRVYNSQPIKFEQQFNYKDFSQLGNRWLYYQGQFKNDSKHGKGYIKLTNGEIFEGLFDHDMIEGNGIFYKKKGEIVIGFWIDNKLFLNQSYQHEKKA